jgi:hypothetical protein
MTSTTPSKRAPGPADDSGGGLVMLVVFTAAVLIVTAAVALLALVGGWWMLGLAFAVHVCLPNETRRRDFTGPLGLGVLTTACFRPSSGRSTKDRPTESGPPASSRRRPPLQPEAALTPRGMNDDIPAR